MTALLTNEYRPFSLAVIGFTGGVACTCDFSCPSRAPGTAINAANAKQSLLFTRYLLGNHATTRSGKVGNLSRIERGPRPAFDLIILICRGDRCSVLHDD